MVGQVLAFFEFVLGNRLITFACGNLLPVDLFQAGVDKASAEAHGQQLELHASLCPRCWTQPTQGRDYNVFSNIPD